MVASKGGRARIHGAFPGETTELGGNDTMGRKPAYKDGWFLVCDLKPTTARLAEIDAKVLKLEARLKEAREERATMETGDSHVQELLSFAADNEVGEKGLLRLENGKIIGYAPMGGEYTEVSE